MAIDSIFLRSTAVLKVRPMNIGSEGYADATAEGQRL
jgi:hypothetical protein